MNVIIYSTHKFERSYLEAANAGKHSLKFIDNQLTVETVTLAKGCEAACIFVNDDASGQVLSKLSESGVKYLALRSAGYNHVDLDEAKRLNMNVARVPEYSPHAIAEHTVALILALNRKLIRAHNRVMDQNFSLDGLTGFDLNGKTIGIIGTGKIGCVVAKIMHGFGCRILANDKIANEEIKNSYGAVYTDLQTLCAESDIITLHIPLTPETKYLIDSRQILNMKRGVMLINTSRGGLINTRAVIKSLKTGQIGYLGLDVYEEESGLFFKDHSENILQDDVIARLMTFKNVLITSHQAFLTDEALNGIAETTMHNLNCWSEGRKPSNELG